MAGGYRSAHLWSHGGRPHGDANGPREGHAEALRRFLKDPEGIVAAMRRELRWAFLYRPIRIAPNMENRLGVQFMNKFTGNQSRLIQE